MFFCKSCSYTFIMRKGGIGGDNPPQGRYAGECAASSKVEEGLLPGGSRPATFTSPNGRAGIGVIVKTGSSAWSQDDVLPGGNLAKRSCQPVTVGRVAGSQCVDSRCLDS